MCCNITELDLYCVRIFTLMVVRIHGDKTGMKNSVIEYNRSPFSYSSLVNTKDRY